MQETLDAKLPGLLEAFPSTDESFVRVVAQADPTGCRYTGWLLKTLQENQWSLADTDSMRSVLEAFERLKQHWTGHQDINLYTVDSLTEAIEKFIETNEIDESPEPKPDTGSKQLASSGELEVWEITTPEAAALFGRGQGGIENPSTQWPTQNAKIAGRYLADGPLYVVTQGGQSFVQIHFGRHEAKDAKNLNLSFPLAQKIASLFTGQSFAGELGKLSYLPGGWQLRDGDIEEYLKALKHKFITQRTKGFFVDGKWIAPVSDEKFLEDRWKVKEPQFRHTLKMAQKDHDVEIIQRAGHKHPEPTGLQALANAVYELEQT